MNHRRAHGDNVGVQLAHDYLDKSPAGENLDAVALFVGGHGSRERLFFPTTRPLQKKDLILRSLFKPENVEDHSRVLHHRYPIPWEDLGLPHPPVG